MASRAVDASSSSYCNACNAPLADDEAVRAHYGSALHHVNLRRRVADIAPLSAATFARLTAEQAAREREREAASAEVLYICDACRRKFHSEGQFQAHNDSRRHREAVRLLLAAREGGAAAAAGAGPGAAAGAGSGPSTRTSAGAGAGAGSSVGADAGVAASSSEVPSAGPGELIITAEHCVFCWALQEGGIEGNLRHMLAAHSFFVPDAEFCDDPSGLIEYLHAKVIEGRMCLYCDTGKQFESGEAARQHMRDKGHCLMRYDDETHFEEFEQYYDYTEKDGGEEAEGDDEGGDGAELQLGAVGTGGAFIDAGGDLVLPDGSMAHPRHLVRYYKQQPRLPDERKSVRAAMARLALDNAAAGGRGANGGGGGAALALAGRAARSNVNRSAQLSQQRYQSRFDLRTGTNFNMILRRWFRVRILE